MHIVLVFFFLLGGFLLGIQGTDKGIKKCVTLGSLNTVLGIYKLWYGVLTLEVCRLEYPLASHMRQYSNVSYFA